MLSSRLYKHFSILVCHRVYAQPEGEVCPVVEGTFEESVMNDFDVLRSTRTGGKIIRDLEICEEKVTIYDAKKKGKRSREE